MPKPKQYLNCDGQPLPWNRHRARSKRSEEGDYSYALTRVPTREHRLRAGRGYPLAVHFAEVIAARRRTEAKELAQTFCDLVDVWKNETGHLSSITKAIAHPSYLRIIGLARDSTGHEIERLLLRELEAEPDHWFAALTAITGEDPVQPQNDFDESVEAWLRWGRNKGLI
jgi:hypothetical protein